MYKTAAIFVLYCMYSFTKFFVCRNITLHNVKNQLNGTVIEKNSGSSLMAKQIQVPLHNSHEHGCYLYYYSG